jgi:hypothetical protein
MTRNEKKQFAEIMVGVAVMFNADLTKQQLEIWFRLLEDYSLEEIQHAASIILETRKYHGMPTPKEFKECLPGATTQVQLEYNPHAQADIILNHLRLNGASVWPKFTDGITRHLMTTRWYYPRWASQITESETKWWIKEFINAYECYQAAGGHPDALEAPVEIKQLIDTVGHHIGHHNEEEPK